MRTTRIFTLLGLTSIAAGALALSAPGAHAQPRPTIGGGGGGGRVVVGRAPPATALTVRPPRPAIVGLSNPGYWDRKKGGSAWGVARSVVNVPPIGGACTTPDLARCRELGFLESACGRTHQATCTKLLKDDAERQWKASPANGTILAPDSMRHGGKLEAGKDLKYDRNRIVKTAGSGGSFASRSQDKLLPASFSSMSTAPRHPEWEAHGNAVTSCDEYVYKKYYDYVRFEEAAASCKGDYVCIFNLAMMPTTPGLNRVTLSKKHGAPMPVQLRPQPGHPSPATTFPKNAFFIETPDLFVAGAEYPSGHAKPTTYTVSDRWAWHTQLSASHASYHMTQAEYDDLDRRQDDMRALIATYRDLRESLAGSSTLSDILNWKRKDGCGNVFGIDPITHEPITHTAPGGRPCPAPRPPTYPPDSLAYALQLSIKHAQSAVTAETLHVDPHDGVTVDHGCVNTDSTRCDWSYKLFVEEYLHRFTKEREEDYNRCFDVIGDQPADWTTDSWPPITAANTANTDALDAYMADAIIQRAALTADITWVEPDVIGNGKSEQKQMGDQKWFATGYSYLTEWKAKLGRKGDAASGGYCKASGSVRANLDGDIWLLNNKKSIVHFDFSADLDKAHPSGSMSSSFTIVDVPIYTAMRNQPMQWTKTETKDLGGPKYSYTFPIMGVPVQVGAGADLTAGYDIDLKTSAPQDCAGSGDLFRMDASFTPRVGINAVAWAAVTFGVADVGIEGSINLLTMKLPVRASARIGLDAKSMMSLALDTGTKLELSELSGGIDAFEEVCAFVCFKTHQGLFSWGGLKQEVALFDLTKTYPLASLRRVRLPKGRK